MRRHNKFIRGTRLVWSFDLALVDLNSNFGARIAVIDDRFPVNEILSGNRSLIRFILHPIAYQFSLLFVKIA